MPRALGQRDDDRSGVLCVLPLSEEKSNKAALGDRTGGERVVEFGKPAFRRVVMDVVEHDQCDQHVRVQKRRHASSSNGRTSSVVNTVPTETTIPASASPSPSNTDGTRAQVSRTARYTWAIPSGGANGQRLRFATASSSAAQQHTDSRTGFVAGRHRRAGPGGAGAGHLPRQGPRGRRRDADTLCPRRRGQRRLGRRGASAAAPDLRPTGDLDRTPPRSASMRERCQLVAALTSTVYSGLHVSVSFPKWSTGRLTTGSSTMPSQRIGGRGATPTIPR